MESVLINGKVFQENEIENIMIIASMYPTPFDLQERHDQNSTLIVDGKIFSYEEEKLTSTKNEATVRFPERSLMMGMKELKIHPKDVDIWVFPKPTEINLKSMYFFFSSIMKAYLDKPENFEKWFKRKIKFVPHQIAHASLAIFGSSFDESAFLCLDGGGDLGDLRNFIFGEYKNQNFKVTKSKKGLKNIGSFHAMIADSLGYPANENGKVSGLSGYGKIIPELKKEFEKLIQVNENGIIFDRKRYKFTDVNLNKIRPKEYNRSKIFNTYPSDTNIFRASSSYLPQDIAATGEAVFVESVLHLIKLVKKLTKSKNMVFSGGVFQNVSLNNAIHESKIFEHVYFPMANGDGGLSLGAALFVENKYKIRERKTLLTPLLGPSYKDDEIEILLDQARIRYVKDDEIEKTTAKLIDAGHIVGWFQGRGEYGPRSLGNRSILADPRKFQSKSKINQLLKKRDWFMPYAPSILEEDLNEFVKHPNPSPYMQIAFKIKNNKKNSIPAAVHIDNTSRFHTVNKNTNPKFWNLINEFKKITGLSMLLNTSFNRHRIPTISEPRQAIEHLLDGCMDYLAIGNYLISFDENRLSKEPFKIEETETFSLKRDCVKRLILLLTVENNLENIIKYVESLSKFLKIKLSFDGEIFLINGKNIQENEIEKELLAICGE